jgi:hypothetical protein
MRLWTPAASASPLLHWSQQARLQVCLHRERVPDVAELPICESRRGSAMSDQPTPPLSELIAKLPRYDLMQVNSCYTSDHEMERSDDGEWVRVDAVLEALATSAPHAQGHHTAEMCPYCNPNQPFFARLREELSRIKSEAWNWARLLDTKHWLTIGETASIASCLRALYWYGVENYVVPYDPPVAPHAQGWQDISTAPKDGTAILTVVAQFKDCVPAVSSWVTYKGESRWSIDPEEFCEDGHFDEHWAATRYDPTHWMPLPAPPAAEPASKPGIP